MAKVWRVYDGKEPTVGGPWVRLALSEAVALFGLKPADFISDLNVTPHFGDTTRDLRYEGFKHIVVEIERSEARQAKWAPGFYRARVTPQEAFRRLLQQALVSELGPKNVVRVEPEPVIDSHGRDALKVTVVIAPHAIKKIQDKAVLNALVRLQERLRELGEDRFAIIEYATEAELAHDGGAQF